jgi:hypothetical protein
MTQNAKVIAGLGLSTSATRNAQIVNYKKFQFVVYVDNGGLDIITLGDINETSEISQELFNKIFDNNYATTGLIESIIKAGATIKPVKTYGKYNLYKVNSDYELWRGRMGGKWSFRAGYVSHPDNIIEAAYAADEEMRYLSAEAL